MISDDEAAIELLRRRRAYELGVLIAEKIVI